MQKNRIAKALLPAVAITVLLSILSAPVWSGESTAISAQDRVLINALSEKKVTFDDIKPVLEKRCIVCHGYYDAPCQLKLTAHAGALRGPSKLKVYDKKRFDWQQPTRLLVSVR